MSLPAESLARRLDAELLGEVRGGWEITALDEASLESAAELADRWSAPGGPEQAGQRVAVWMAPRHFARAAQEVAGALSNLALLAGDDARGWELASTVLDRLESLQAVRVLVASDTILVRWTRSGSAPASMASSHEPD